ncbi:MAG TPA: hypothetical protein VFC46_17705 [Humisphaera sp.]|nr:hypothetical protein [Humisphaera sp.]
MLAERAMEEVTREQIDLSINAKDFSVAQVSLGKFWRHSPTAAAAGFVVSRFETLRPHITLTRCKVAILRSFTVEPAVPLLRALAFVGGIDLDARLGDFDSYVQEVLNTSGWVYEFSPDVAILAVQTRDIVPALWDGFADLDSAAVRSAIEDALSRYRLIIKSFRAKSSAHLIIHSLQIPTPPALGLLDNRNDFGQAASIAQSIRDFANSPALKRMSTSSITMP